MEVWQSAALDYAVWAGIWISILLNGSALTSRSVPLQGKSEFLCVARTALGFDEWPFIVASRLDWLACLLSSSSVSYLGESACSFSVFWREPCRRLRKFRRC
eukprot:3953342-Amphidinium_carterae.1